MSSPKPERQNQRSKTHGESTLNGLRKEKESYRDKPWLKTDHALVLNTFRLLVADLCEQFSGGHLGGAIGMAAIGVALWKYVMRYSPHQPTYFNRDRFILSNGHACLFQYCFLHLTGYKNMTTDQLKSYHSNRADTLCQGHPEIETEGIELTTGPLGQGVANAVGLAIAAKNIGATYNRPGYDLVNCHTFCMVGDACLQQGVALEAISFAGHLMLDNLTIIYDNNKVTCDGSVDLSNTEDVNTKMAACGWEVIEIYDGCYDVEALVIALRQARDGNSRKPTFVNVHTIIGAGSAVAGDATAHGVALGSEDVAAMKILYGFDPQQHFVVPNQVRDFFADLPRKGETLVENWQHLFDTYTFAHPLLASEFDARLKGEIRVDWKDFIPTQLPTSPTPSRTASGLVFTPLAKALNTFMVGTADLSPSVNMAWDGKEDFQNPSLKTTCGLDGSYAGRYIHYGVREHAMAGIANGLAAFHPGTIIPITSTFFMFYLYATPAIRMSALQNLHTIHLATHDSIGMGADGPTHQPVELAALYRAMPNLLYLRPGDSEEVAGAWLVALQATSTPSIISTSRHPLPQTGLTNRNSVSKGAYILREADDPHVTLLGAGTELSFALEVADGLAALELPVRARVVSFPCWALFEQQSRAYRRSVLQREGGVPAVVIEAFSGVGWERYADAGIVMTGFGKSLPGEQAYEWFGFEREGMVRRVKGFVGRWWGGEVGRGEWEAL